MDPPQGSGQDAQAAAEQLWCTKLPESVPFEQLRDWLLQLEPQATDEAWKAVTLAPLLTVPPHGAVQLTIMHMLSVGGGMPMLVGIGGATSPPPLGMGGGEAH